jgi:hypothetical protein
MGGDVCHPNPSIIEISIGRLQECRQDADRPAEKPHLSPVCLARPQASELSFDALQVQLKVRAINPHHLTFFRKTSINERSTINDLTLSPACDSALLL